MRQISPVACQERGSAEENSSDRTARARREGGLDGCRLAQTIKQKEERKTTPLGVGEVSCGVQAHCQRQCRLAAAAGGGLGGRLSRRAIDPYGTEDREVPASREQRVVNQGSVGAAAT